MMKELILSYPHSILPDRWGINEISIAGQ